MTLPAVNVRFYDRYHRDELGGGIYYYAAFEHYEVGTTVVVDTRNGLALAQVVGYPTAPPTFDIAVLRTVVCAVPVKEWKTKLAKTPLTQP